MRRKNGSETEPMLVRCTLKLPARRKKEVGMLGLAFGCGGATAERTKQGDLRIEAVIEIEKVGEIVEKGIPVMVTERIPIQPIPAKEIIRDAEAWLAAIRKPLPWRRRR